MARAWNKVFSCALVSVGGCYWVGRGGLLSINIIQDFVYCNLRWDTTVIKYRNIQTQCSASCIYGDKGRFF